MRCAKKRFRTGAEARRALERIRRQGGKTPDGKPSRAYMCPYCKGWHLTSWGYDGGR